MKMTFRNSLSPAWAPKAPTVSKQYHSQLILNNNNSLIWLGCAEWSSGDEEELVKNIRQFTSKSDKVKYTTRVQRLDWSKIAFKKYTPKQCQSHFNNYLKNVRTYRTLHEVLSDVEEEIKKFPFKKPLNSYQFFIQDQLSKAHSSGDFVSTFVDSGSDLNAHRFVRSS